VLEALEDHDIYPDCVSGTSIGAFIAALYAFGKTPKEILQLIEHLELFDVASLRLSKMGIMSHQQIGKLITDAIGDKNIEDAPMPLAIVSTNVVSGRRHVFRKGPVAQAVLASTAIPGIFHPVILDDEILVDGGLVENVPISPLRELGAECVVGVNLNGSPEYGQPQDAFDILLNATDIALDNTTRLQLTKADAVIELCLSEFSRNDPKQITGLYNAGYRSASKQIGKVTTAMKEANIGPLDLLEKKWREWTQ
jgi:NTE family protein